MRAAKYVSFGMGILLFAGVAQAVGLETDRPVVAQGGPSELPGSASTLQSQNGEPVASSSPGQQPVSGLDLVAETVESDSQGVCIESGGGEVPTPRRFGAQRFELAAGETYVLIGEILVSPTFPTVYFRIDFDAQPWLANVNRVKNPTYPLLGGADQWRRWSGARVKIKVRAVSRIRSSPTGEATYELGLEALSGVCQLARK